MFRSIQNSNPEYSIYKGGFPLAARCAAIPWPTDIADSIDFVEISRLTEISPSVTYGDDGIESSNNQICFTDKFFETLLSRSSASLLLKVVKPGVAVIYRTFYFKIKDITLAVTYDSATLS